MSRRAETKMQIQIVIHGEAFCPSMMTKETPFANRKLLEDDTTNNERNEMEEGRIEENEIEEGHDNVEEEQDNKAKDTPFANRKLLEDDTTNSEKNEMEEGQMQENEIKEGHENVEEEQDYKFLKGFDDQWIAYFYMWNRRVRNLLNGERGQVEENKIKEGQEEVQKGQDNEILEDVVQYLGDFYMLNERQKIESTSACPCCVILPNWERGQVKENKIKEGQEEVQEEQDNEYFSQYNWYCFLEEEQIEEYKKRERQKKKTVNHITSTIENLEIGNLGMRQFDELFWIKKNSRTKVDGLFANSRTKVDGLFENWFRTERSFGQTSGFLRSREFNEEERRINTKFAEILENLVKIEERRLVVVQSNAQKEKRKQIDNPEEFIGKLDDEEKEILELEQLLRCKVCLDSDACIVFFPCRHMATCENCEGFLHCCPVCRSFIEEAVKINEE